MRSPQALSGLTTQPLGTEGQLVDGSVVQAWTISDLQPSADLIPHPFYETLWDATATDEAVKGAATPIGSTSMRVRNGQTYRALFAATTAAPATTAAARSRTFGPRSR
ncbi:MAG: DUF1942 domain-containing protein [Phycisphaerae bacterium]|nr:DUF1942 domain-containing protein [Phycisphaerae bacterium]